MNAANDSLRVNGVGRDASDPRTLVIYFNEKPNDDDLRRIHNLLRDGASPAAAAGVPTETDWAKVMSEPTKHPCAMCNGRGFYGIPGQRCGWCDGKGSMQYHPNLASSPVAPVGAPTRQHSVHLASGDAGQDFRGGTALSDTARLNWLERQTVEVRVAQRYGSRRAIYEIASWDEEQDEPAPSGLRAAIDAAMKENDRG